MRGRVRPSTKPHRWWPLATRRGKYFPKHRSKYSCLDPHSGPFQWRTTSGAHHLELRRLFCPPGKTVMEGPPGRVAAFAQSHEFLDEEMETLARSCSGEAAFNFRPSELEAERRTSKPTLRRSASTKRPTLGSQA